MDDSHASKHRIYTRGGDQGDTSLYSGPRIAKDQARIAVCGDIDELSSILGVVRAEGVAPRHAEILLRIQHELIDFCAEVVCLSPVQYGTRKLGPEQIGRMESEIDSIAPFLSPLTEFVIPGDNKTSATLHWARTVCRRAERGLVSLVRREPDVSTTLLAYLNRLSDLLFVLARREAC